MRPIEEIRQILVSREPKDKKLEKLKQIRQEFRHQLKSISEGFGASHSEKPLDPNFKMLNEVIDQLETRNSA